MTCCWNVEKKNILIIRKRLGHPWLKRAKENKKRAGKVDKDTTVSIRRKQISIQK